MRKHLIVIALLAGLVANVARADLEKGTYAPDIGGKDWINAETPISLKDMRGLVVVLFFWVSHHRGGEFAMEDINIVHNHRALGGNRGVMVIGVTDSDRKRVQKTLEKEKVTFPVALESKAYEEYKIESFPRVVVIDPEGKIAWSGGPQEADAGVKAIFDVLAETPPSRTRPQEVVIVNRRLEEARQALRKGDFREAHRAAHDAFEHAVTGDPLKATCQDMVELIDMIGRDRVEEVEGLVDDKKFDRAVDNLRWVVRNFYGTDISREARKRLNNLKKQYEEIAALLKTKQSTVDAARLLNEAREEILAQRFGPAYEKLEKIGSDYKDSEVAPAAADILKRMGQNAVVMKDVRDFKARKECDTLLASARNAIAAGRKDDAEKALRQVIDKHPETSYAEQAKQMLIGLR